MANPDTTSLNMNVLTISLPIAFFFLLLITFMFQMKDSIPSFQFVLWVSVIALSFVVISIVNVTTQYINCKTTNVGKAMLGSLTSVVSIIIALVISSISYCRIPIASVFAPLFVRKTINITKNKQINTANTLKNINSKECCLPSLTLETVENQYPVVAGLAYGFYVMFGILFGSVIGGGISSIC